MDFKRALLAFNCSNRQLLAHRWHLVTSILVYSYSYSYVSFCKSMARQTDSNAGRTQVAQLHWAFEYPMETLLNAYTGTYHHYREESQRHQTASHNLFFVLGSLARQSSKCAHNVHLFRLRYRAVSDTRVVAVLPIGAFFRGEIMIIIKMTPPFRPWRYYTGNLAVFF